MSVYHVEDIKAVVEQLVVKHLEQQSQLKKDLSAKFKEMNKAKSRNFPQG